MRRRATGARPVSDRGRGPARRWFIAGALLVSSVLAWATTLHAHARLLSSVPAAGSKLAQSPGRFRLVFSEPIEAGVSTLSIVGADGRPRRLLAKADPRDVSAFIAEAEPLPAGAYRVQWSTVSADGHRISGSFAFSVDADTTAAKPQPLPPPLPDSAETQPEAGARYGILAALTRGAGIGLLMAFAGVLFFARISGNAPALFRLELWLGVATIALLAANVLAWIGTTAVSASLDSASIRSMLDTGPGRVQLARLGVALLSMWALALARRRTLALVFAAVALGLSGAIGHPAALTPILTIPSRAIHLAAAATWLGGLIWLIARHDGEPGDVALRVSAVAMVSAVLVVLSGGVQSVVFLASPGDLVHTSYGILLLAKIAGTLILLAFGAYHRYRLMPLGSGEAVLQRSVRREVVVFAVVVLLGGVLASTSPGSGLP